MKMTPNAAAFFLFFFFILSLSFLFQPENANKGLAAAAGPSLSLLLGGGRKANDRRARRPGLGRGGDRRGGQRLPFEDEGDPRWVGGEEGGGEAAARGGAERDQLGISRGGGRRRR